MQKVMLQQVQQIKKYICYRYMQGDYQPGQYLDTPIGHMHKDNVGYLIDRQILSADENGKITIYDSVALHELLSSIREKKHKGELKVHWNLDECLEVLIKKVAAPTSKKYELHEVLEYVQGYEKANPQHVLEGNDVDDFFNGLMLDKSA